MEKKTFIILLIAVVALTALGLLLLERLSPDTYNAIGVGLTNSVAPALMQVVNFPFNLGLSQWYFGVALWVFVWIGIPLIVSLFWKYVLSKAKEKWFSSKQAPAPSYNNNPIVNQPQVPLSQIPVQPAPVQPPVTTKSAEAAA